MTDVTKITSNNNLLLSNSYALSFLNSFLSGISMAFEIELHDIGGVIYKNKEGQSEIIIYDNVPGGSGHSKRLMNEELLKEVLLKSYEIVNNECCDGKTSCYNCLRNYYNQNYQHKLVRNYAKQILKTLLGYKYIHADNLIRFCKYIELDGMENASREYSHTMIKKMIDHQKTKYSWDFIFLGANFDAETFSESISIDKDRAVQYVNDKEGIESIYVNLSEELATRRFPIENEKSDTWKKGIKKGK